MTFLCLGVQYSELWVGDIRENLAHNKLHVSSKYNGFQGLQSSYVNNEKLKYFHYPQF